MAKKKKSKPYTPCARCRKRVIGDYPALSRVDSKSEICGPCGTWEALYNLTHKGKKLPKLEEGCKV